MKKILVLFLTVIMILSVCITPLSVFAEEVTDETSEIERVEDKISGDAMVEVAEQIVNSANDAEDVTNLLGNLVKGYAADSKKNPWIDIGSQLALAYFQIFLSDDMSQPEPLDVIQKKLKNIELKMDDYHKQEMEVLGRIELKIDNILYEQYIDKIYALNSQAIPIIEGFSTDEGKFNPGDLSKVDEAGKKRLKSIYSEIMRVTIDMQEYHTNFITTCSKICPVGKPSAYETALNLFYANQNYKDQDATVVAKAYREYLDAATMEVAYAYVCLLTGYKAKVNYCTLTGDPDGKKAANIQGEKLYLYMKKVLNYYIAAVDECNKIVKAGVKLDQKEKKYFDFTMAWEAVNNALKNGKEVEMQLYQDWTADNKCGFSKENYGSTATDYGYTRDGGLFILGKGKLTIGLNGHLINGCGRQMSIFEVDNQANLIIKGLSAEKLLDGQRQGLINSARGINFSQTNNSKVSIDLENVWMDGMKDHGIFLESNTTNAVLTYNGGGIDHAERGAILIKGQAKFTIKNCDFNGNGTNASGGAIGIYDIYAYTPNSTVDNCSFYQNSAKNSGGAIYCSCQISNCTFVENTAGRKGGAVMRGSSIQNSTFKSNSSKIAGGAVYAYGNIEKCEFENNTCDGEGGAVYTAVTQIKITNSKFRNNQSKNGTGGAIYDYHLDLLVDGCEFDGNKAQTNGGAIEVRRELDITLKNSKFTNNRAEKEGGAVNTQYRARVIAENCEFTNNFAGTNGGALLLAPLRSYYHFLKNVTVKNNQANQAGGGVYCQKDAPACGDVDILGTVIITDNTANNKQSNVYLEQAGFKKCILDARDLNHSTSKIGLSSNLSDDVCAVYKASSITPFFGDNGRKLYQDGSDIIFDKQ